MKPICMFGGSDRRGAEKIYELFYTANPCNPHPKNTNIRAFEPLWNLALGPCMRSGDSSALSILPWCVAFSCLRTKYRANELKETTSIFGKVGASCWPDDTSPLSVSSNLRNSHRCCTGEPSLDSTTSLPCPCPNGRSSGVLA